MLSSSPNPSTAEKRCLEFCEGLGKVVISVSFTKTKTAAKVAVPAPSPQPPQPFQKGLLAGWGNSWRNG